MDIDKIINSYRSKVNAGDDNPEKVAQAKDETLNKVKNVSVLAGLLDNIRKLVANLGMSVRDAFDTLEVPAEDRERYVKMLREQRPSL